MKEKSFKEQKNEPEVEVLEVTPDLQAKMNEIAQFLNMYIKLYVL